MMHKLNILFLLLITAIAVHANNSINFNHLNGQKGVPKNILSIYQDEIGVMWFGTIEGICRYNGNGSEMFTPSVKYPGLTQNVIYDICGNKKGTIYFKANYDIIKYDIAREQFECIWQKDAQAFYWKDDLLWFATDTAIYQYDELNQTVRWYGELKTHIGEIESLCVADNELIWVGTKTNLTIIKQSDPNDQRIIMEDINTSVIYTDSRQNVWVGTQKNGLYLFDSNGKLISRFIHVAGKNSISNNQVRSIAEDNSGNIWIGTFFGLNYFDVATQQWSVYIHVDNIPNSISHSSVPSVYCDAQGTLWIGTYFGGVNYYNPEADVFKFYSANSQNQNYLSFPFIGNMVEDTSGNLWICTEGGGLNRLNLKTRQISRYMYQGNDLESVMEYNQKCIWYRPDKESLYIGMHNGGLSIFDIQTKNHKVFTHDRSDELSLPSNIINDMQYYNGELILLTSAGLVRMDINTNKFYPFITDKVINRFLAKSQKSKFRIDRNNQIWIPMHEGLLRINLLTKQIKEFRHNPENPHSIGKLRIVDILETTTGELYFATSGSGLFRYRPTEEDFISYTEEKDGLFSNYCYSVKEAPSGNLLILFNKGMAFFDPDNHGKKLFQSSSDFPLTGFFHGCTSYTTSEGEIFIGGVNGLVSVYESQLENLSSGNYNLYFDKLQVNNVNILPGDETGILNTTLPECDYILLNHQQNNIIIDYATSNYLYSNSQNFQYKLEGFDTDWNPVTSHHIVYTNINPGKYKLLIREIPLNGNKMTPLTRELRIKIKPPFYASSIAYMLYVTLFILLLFLTVRFFIWREKLHVALELERKEKERNEELTKTKLRFFTNISHELRTPLTLIIGQMETLLQHYTLSNKIHGKINRIYWNATHMRDLISELLDFRKQEQGFYKLKVEQVELVSYIRDIFEVFQEYAVKRQIKYKFEQPEAKIKVYIDPVHFRKAIYNILSNAFKYTPADGEITIRFCQQNDKVTIQIEDTGIGIPAESLSKIFDRFYQIEYRSSGLSLGTGIGLALTKEIVNSHKGEVSVNSVVDKGSTFEITLLYGNEHFEKEQLVDSLSVRSRYLVTDHIYTDESEWQQLPVIDESITNEEQDVTLESGDNEHKNSILIVEDNEDLLELLEEVFTKTYKVYTATNGKEALSMVVDLTPDIVLSDVMMPEMSGKELCYKIKNNVHLSHIPVVLLTAQTTTSQKMEGYIFGADDYVTKPFNIDILVLRCNNLIKNRQLLLHKMIKPIEPKPVVNTLSEYDKDFIEKATVIIKQNFDNPDFDMNMLANELGLGRSKLYSRIKEVIGLTPNEFTLSLKLQEAVHLLENSLHLNISEIAYTLGFSSIKYFSKNFKSFYGITPAAWRKKKLEEGSSGEESNDKENSIEEKSSRQENSEEKITMENEKG